MLWANYVYHELGIELGISLLYIMCCGPIE